MLAQGVRFARVVVWRGAEAELLLLLLGGGRGGAAVAEKGGGGRERLLGVGVFGGGGVVGAAAEEFSAGLRRLLEGLRISHFVALYERVGGKRLERAYAVFAVFFQTGECLPVVQEIGAEGFDAFLGFFLFCWDELLFGGFGVVVYCSRKGG